MDEKILRTLRLMAWERAKGEIQSILQTYWDHEDKRWEEFDNKVKEFIKYIEDNGLQE